MLRGPIVTSSHLNAAPAEVWEHCISFEGVNAEFGGLLRMTAPREAREAGLASVVLGERLCRSWILVFGVIPFDYDGCAAAADAPRPASALAARPRGGSCWPDPS